MSSNYVDSLNAKRRMAENPVRKSLDVFLCNICWKRQYLPKKLTLWDGEILLGCGHVVDARHASFLSYPWKKSQCSRCEAWFFCSNRVCRKTRLCGACSYSDRHTYYDMYEWLANLTTCKLCGCSGLITDAYRRYHMKEIHNVYYLNRSTEDKLYANMPTE